MDEDICVLRVLEVRGIISEGGPRRKAADLVRRRGNQAARRTLKESHYRGFHGEKNHREVSKLDRLGRVI